MTLTDAMHAACAAVGIKPPKRIMPGRWAYTDTHQKNGKGDGRVLIDADGTRGVAYNWQTGEHRRFPDGQAAPAVRRDPVEDRRIEAERREIAEACERIVKACRAEPHPYLAAKGFPDEVGLVIDDPRPHLPNTRAGEAAAYALPEGAQFLVVPGRIGKSVTTVQFITPDGAKRNIKGGQMGGTAHRIATGRETWVCEGIATALTVRAALRFLGRSATVLSAFSASNVGKVASGLSGAIIAADHDKPLEQFGGMGTGEYYARQSGRVWTMPQALGDFNDMHQAGELRDVALHLKGVPP